MNGDIDILGLAAQAKERGYNSLERVVQRLEDIIKRNAAYRARRMDREIYTAYDQAVEEDIKVVALAIVLLESTACKE